MGGAGHSPLSLALEQPEWDAETGQKGVELLPAVRPQQPLGEKGMSPGSGPELSCTMICNMVLSAVQQRSASLQYPVVRAVPWSVACEHSYSLPGRAQCSWRRLTRSKPHQSLSILVHILLFLSVGLFLGLRVFCTTTPSVWVHETGQYEAVSPLQFTTCALSLIPRFIKCSLSTKLSCPASHELHKTCPLWVTGWKELCICSYSLFTDWPYPENPCLS